MIFISIRHTRGGILLLGGTQVERVANLQFIFEFSEKEVYTQYFVSWYLNCAIPSALVIITVCQICILMLAKCTEAIVSIIYLFETATNLQLKLIFETITKRHNDDHTMHPISKHFLENWSRRVSGAGGGAPRARPSLPARSGRLVPRLDGAPAALYRQHTLFRAQI